MNIQRHHLAAAWAAAALLAMSGAHAGTGSKSSSASGADSTYRTERAACMEGRTGQDRATCLKEAGAAREEIRRSRLADRNSVDYQANAVARCQRLPADQKALCERRASGEGTQTGSVASGGVMRELVVREPAATPSPTPAQ